MRRMVFHLPMAFRPGYVSGSVVRPQKMVAAFGAIGYDVHLVWGSATERRASIRALERRVDAGEVFDFVYSESANAPTLLTEQHHLPLSPLLDFGFLWRMRRRGIPVGLFYRDIYWCFPIYRATVGWLKSLIAKTFFWIDLLLYSRVLNILYLPSVEMGEWIPYRRLMSIARALPPGCSVPVANSSTPSGATDEQLSLLYVGGVVPPIYDLRPLLESLKSTKCHLTLVCRESEWKATQEHYRDALSDRISIVHASGGEIERLYAKADAAIVINAFDHYRDFAMPVKLFESIGHAVPVLIFSGAAATRFILDNNLGWAVGSVEEMAGTLRHLQEHRDEVMHMRRLVAHGRSEHTWEARARQVAADLTKNQH